MRKIGRVMSSGYAVEDPLVFILNLLKGHSAHGSPELAVGVAATCKRRGY